MRVTNIRFHPAAEDLRSRGLRGWATCTIDGTWTFASIAVRRASDGRYLLAFPTRRDCSGEEYAYYHPTRAEVRREIEDAVLGFLRKGGWIQ